MIRKITLLFLACFGFYSMANAQYCGFDTAHHRLLATDPAYAAAVAQMDAAWAQIQQGPLPNALVGPANYGPGKAYQIPVVIHVMLPGGANPIGSLYNPTDAQLIGMVDYLNKAYAAQWAGYPDTSSGGTRIPFEFVLAKRDSNCNTTTGIERVDASGVANYTSGGVQSATGIGTPDINIKNLTRWPVDRYYNIWIVNKIDGEDGTGPGPFVAGFAYLAPAPANEDGTIMLALTSTAGEITLPHEIGHAMTLYHTFEGGNATTCPPLAPCASTGDLVCDTEPEKQSQFNCPSDPNPCTGISYNNVQHNFMDYSSCQNRFTPGQRTRMLNGLLSYRGGFTGSLGGVATGTSPAGAACNTVTAQPSNTFNAGPREVKISDASYTYLDYSTSGYNGDGNLAYWDLSCKEGATLDAGSTYTLAVKTGFWTEKVRVYLDMNNDGTFAPSELIFSHDGTLNNETHTTSWVVPSVVTNPTLVTCTPLRMRVVTDRTAAITNPDPCNVVSGQAEDYSITIIGSGAGGGTVSIAQLNGLPVSCNTDTLNFSATAANVVNPTYKWFVNNVSTGITTSTYSSNTLANGDVVTAKIYFATTCGSDSSVSNGITITHSGIIPPSATIALTTGNPVNCTGDTLTYSVTATVNPGTNPTYKWYVNGVQVGTGSSYTSSTLNTGDQVHVQITSNSACAIPDTGSSNYMTVTHGTITPMNSIALINGNNPGCPNQVLTFQATPTNGGSSPTYTWYVNGAAAPGSTNIFSGTFNNGDVITSTLHSSASCASPDSGVSNPVTVVISYDTQTVTILTAAAMPVCATHWVTFQATTLNIGETIQWQVNGVNIPGATNNIFTTNTLADGDVVTAVISIVNSCIYNPVDTSNPITVTVLPSTTPSLSATITQGNNPGCLDSLVEFTGTYANFGTNPNVVWLVNGTQVATGTVFSSTGLLNGDVVTFRVNQTDGDCYTSDTLSQSTIMTLSPTPPTPLLSLIGNMLVATGSGDYIWYGPNGLIPGATTNMYHPTVLGPYWCVNVTTGCRSNPSNVLTISLLDIGTYNLSEVKIYPNPTNGQVILDWGSNVNVKVDVFNITGQGLLHQDIVNQSKKVMDLSYLPSGDYFLVIKDETGNTGTVKVTVAK